MNRNEKREQKYKHLVKSLLGPSAVRHCRNPYFENVHLKVEALKQNLNLMTPPISKVWLR